MPERVKAALELYPADLLVIHRDSEGQPAEMRLAEIEAGAGESTSPFVRLVPVRMQEAWFLFDEPAIRHAAENPYGTMELDLPDLGQVESVPNPKAVLFEALRTASGVTGRHLRRFGERRAAHRVAELIVDYSPLRELPAFTRFEAEIRHAVQSL